jgi:hypothetical protein
MHSHLDGIFINDTNNEMIWYNILSTLALQWQRKMWGGILGVVPSANQGFL